MNFVVLKENCKCSCTRSEETPVGRKAAPARTHTHTGRMEIEGWTSGQAEGESGLKNDAPLSVCVSMRRPGSNYIMALWWRRRPPLVQTHHTGALFWVTKLNILAGLFLAVCFHCEHSARAYLCMCVHACACVSKHLSGSSP